MGHLLAKHPHVNIALVIAVLWGALAVAAAFIDIVRTIQTW